jgi:hypothetical protein
MLLKPPSCRARFIGREDVSQIISQPHRVIGGVSQKVPGSPLDGDHARG